MKRYLLAVGGVLALACSALAQEPKLVQPKKLLPAPPKGEQARRLAEEVEGIEAHLGTKKAVIVAAQVAVKAAELAVKNAFDPARLEEAKLAVEAAKAQLMIREAEANEVLVRLKHAKRRAADSEVAQWAAEDAEMAAMMKAIRDKTEADLTAATAKLDQANKEVARLEELLKRGIVAPADLAEARAKQTAAQHVVTALERQLGMQK